MFDNGIQSTILTVSKRMETQIQIHFSNHKAHLRAALGPCNFKSNIFGYHTLQIVKHGLQVCTPQLPLATLCVGRQVLLIARPGHLSSQPSTRTPAWQLEILCVCFCHFCLPVLWIFGRFRGQSYPLPQLIDQWTDKQRVVLNCPELDNKWREGKCITTARWTQFIPILGFARVKIAFRLVRQDIWRAEIDFILNTSYSMYRWRNTQIFRTAL